MNITTNKTLLYFGCIRNTGHYIWEDEVTPSMIGSALIKKMPGVNTRIFSVIDGVFAPGNEGKEEQYNDCIVAPLIIVAWWDYSIDSRPGSNSAFIGYGFNNAEEIINAAMKQFPSVIARQKKLVPWKK